MPAYNREKYIKDAIDSILNQTYDNFEFIIINDGSNDNTYDIVKNYSDSRINLINNKINMGISWSSNKGLAIARGKYIARMDSDDICMSQRFRKQIDFMEKNPEIGVCGTWRIDIDQEGTIIKKFKTVTTHDEIKFNLFFGCPITNPTVMIRKSILDVNNVKYDSRFVKSQDYKFWIDLLELTRFAVIPEFLLYYRYHATQISKYKNKGLLSNRNILAERLIGRSLTNQELECHTLLLSREPNYQVIKAAEFEEWITLLKQSNNSKKKYIEPEFSKNIDKAKNDMYKRAINSSVITSKRYSPMCLIKILISRGKFFKYLPSITLFKLCGKCLLCLRK